jgi:hypothetical protein
MSRSTCLASARRQRLPLTSPLLHESRPRPSFVRLECDRVCHGNNVRRCCKTAIGSASTAVTAAAEEAAVELVDLVELVAGCSGTTRAERRRRSPDSTTFGNRETG